MTHHGRYNQRDRLNRQELAAVREREQVERDLVKYGHDEQAATRARRIVNTQEIMATFGLNLPDEQRGLLAAKLETEVAEIRASGPVGCACGYWRCVESRPSREAL